MPTGIKIADIYNGHFFDKQAVVLVGFSIVGVALHMNSVREICEILHVQVEQLLKKMLHSVSAT